MKKSKLYPNKWDFLNNIFLKHSFILYVQFHENRVSFIYSISLAYLHRESDCISYYFCY